MELLGEGGELRGVVRLGGWGWRCEFTTRHECETSEGSEESKLTQIFFSFVRSVGSYREDGYQYPDDGAGFDFGADDGGQPMEGIDESMKPIANLEGTESSLVVSSSFSSFLPLPSPFYCLPFSSLPLFLSSSRREGLCSRTRLELN